SGNAADGRFVGGRRRGDRRKAIAMAKQGDMAAIRLCMDRLSPPRKGEPVAFELPPLEKPADSVPAAATNLAPAAARDLAPSEAAELAKVIDVYVRAIATNALRTSYQSRRSSQTAARWFSIRLLDAVMGPAPRAVKVAVPR